MDTEIIKLSSTDIEDFSNLIKLFKEVFEWEGNSLPSKSHLQKVLGNSNFLVFVAKTDQKLVGGLTVHVLERYDAERPAAYLYDIAVLPDQQRKGIGKLLIASLTDYCRTNGFSEVFVQAETEDINAVNFYKTTNISSELAAIHFTYCLDSSQNPEK